MQTEEKKTESTFVKFLQETKIFTKKAKETSDAVPKLTSEVIQACDEWQERTSTFNSIYVHSDQKNQYYYRPITEFRDSFYELLKKGSNIDYSNVMADIGKELMYEVSKKTQFVPKEFKDEYVYVFDKEGHLSGRLNTNVGTIGTQNSCAIVIERKDGTESAAHALYFCMVDKKTSDTILFLIDFWSAGGTYLQNSEGDDIAKSEYVKTEKNGRRLMMLNLSKSPFYFAFGYTKDVKLAFMLKRDEEIAKETE